MKKCSRCKQDKGLSDFYKNKATKDGYGKVCKNCRQETESEPHKKYAKEHYQKNKEKLNSQSKKWVEENKAKVAVYKKEWNRKKHKLDNSSLNKSSNTDTEIRRSWRNSLYRCLTGKESKSLEKLLGYSSNTLKRHLEISFLPGMSWDNYGTEWAVDHIIPICNFPVSTPLLIVNALTNLRPLWNRTQIVNGVQVIGNLNRPKRLELSLDQYPATIILDIDGVIFKHHGSLQLQLSLEPEILPGVLEKLNQWIKEDHTIILVTGRKESMRSKTIEQLDKFNIPYSHLIMGLPRGQRWIINDLKPDSDIPTAMAKNVLRNEGLENVYV